MAVVTTAAPARMKAIIADTRVAAIRPSRKLCQFSAFWALAMTSARMTPITAASVGEAMPP